MRHKTHVHLQDSEDYRLVVRMVHVLPTVDRLGIGLVTGVPFGTVSRIISELDTDGYITSPGSQVDLRLRYEAADTKPYKLFEVTTKNGTRHNWNYGNCERSTSTIYGKTDKWPLFMRAYDRFLRRKGRA
jgi:hypothetical protein